MSNDTSVRNIKDVSEVYKKLQDAERSITDGRVTNGYKVIKDIREKYGL